MTKGPEWRRTADYPQAWFLGFGLLIWIIGRAFPINTGAFAIPGWILLIAGFALMGWAPIHFRRARTSISPFGQPSALITDGPFRLSRNPIYLADVMVLGGLCLIASAPQALILLPVFIWLITTRFIRREEARLAETFPQDFAAYRRQTRRWL